MSRWNTLGLNLRELVCASSGFGGTAVCQVPTLASEAGASCGGARICDHYADLYCTRNAQHVDVCQVSDGGEGEACRDFGPRCAAGFHCRVLCTADLADGQQCVDRTDCRSGVCNADAMGVTRCG